MDSDLAAEAALKKSMDYAKGMKNKASFYTQVYMQEAVTHGKSAKKNKDFWKGLAKFDAMEFDAALALFEKASKSAKG